MHSTKYTGFNEELQTMNNYINSDDVYIRLNINEADRTQMSNYMMRFETIMSQYRNPKTKTAVVTEQVSDDYKVIYQWVADFRQKIKHSHKGTLTREDYASLFIHKDKAHSKHTIPDTSPTLEMEHIEHLNARISAHHHTTQDKGTRPSLPEGVDIIDWHWVVTDNKESPELKNYTNQLTARSANLKLEFMPDQERLVCHVVARYGIANGETGTFSKVLMFIIT